MTTKKTLILALTLLTAGALATSCSSEDNTIDGTPQTQQPAANEVKLTATLAPKGDDGTQTRAITSGTDTNGKEVLNTTWEVGEEIAVYYTNESTDYTSVSATVTAVNGDGSATIEATFPSGKTPDDGSTAKFIYPSYLMDSYGNVEFNAMPDGPVSGMCLRIQFGNLTGTNSISLGTSTTCRGGCDLCTGTGKMKHIDDGNGGTAITVVGSKGSGPVTMENQVCICKFHFDLDGGTSMASSIVEKFSPITINDGNGHEYTIKSDRTDEMIGGATRGFTRDDDIYVALLPIEGKTVTFSFQRLTSGGTVTYSATKTNVTLEKGKFYRNLPTIYLVKQN